MRTAHSLTILLGLTPFLWNCASQQDMQSMELRMRTMDSRVVDLNRNIDLLENRTTKQAAMTTTMDRLESEILQLKARIDENTHFLKNAQQENNNRFQSMHQENEKRYQVILEALQQRLAQVEGENEQLKAEMAGYISTLKTDINQLNTNLEQTAAGVTEIKKTKVKEAAEQAAAAAREADQARQAAARASEPREIAPENPVKRHPGSTDETPASAPTPAAAAATGRDGLYDKAYSHFKAERYKEAYNTFHDFIEKNPRSPLTPSARFWLAESLFNQKEFELSILEYQKVISDHPKDANAPTSLYKQGMAFERLKDNETAKIIYRKLIKEYPGSEQARNAQGRLDKL
jgi:tol-pal system protein YbgF